MSTKANIQVRDLLYDKDFFSLSPRARELVFQQVALQDNEYQALSPSAKHIVFQQIMSRTQPMREKIIVEPQPRPALVPPPPEEAIPTPAMVPEPPVVQAPPPSVPSREKIIVEPQPRPTFVPPPAEEAIPTPEMIPEPPVLQVDEFPTENGKIVVPLDNNGNPVLAAWLVQNDGAIASVLDAKTIVPKLYQERAAQQTRQKRLESQKESYANELAAAFARGSLQALQSQAGAAQMLGERPAISSKEIARIIESQYPKTEEHRKWEKEQLQEAVEKASSRPEWLNILTTLSEFAPILSAVGGIKGVSSLLENPKRGLVGMAEQAPQTVVDMVLGMIPATAIKIAGATAAVKGLEKASRKKKLLAAVGYGAGSAFPEAWQEAGDQYLQTKDAKAAWKTLLGNMALLTGSNTLEAFGILDPAVFLRAGFNTAGKIKVLSNFIKRIASNERVRSVLERLPKQTIAKVLEASIAILSETGIEGAEEYLQQVIQQVSRGGSLLHPTPLQQGERQWAAEQGRHMGLAFGGAAAIRSISGGEGGAPSGEPLGGGAQKGGVYGVEPETPGPSGVVGESGGGGASPTEQTPVQADEEGQVPGSVGTRGSGEGVEPVPPGASQGDTSGLGVGASDVSDISSGAPGTGGRGPDYSGVGEKPPESGSEMEKGLGGTGEGTDRVLKERRNTLNPGIRDRVFPYAKEHYPSALEGEFAVGLADHKFRWIGNSFAEQVSEEANPDWQSIAFDFRGAKEFNTRLGYELTDRIFEAIAERAQFHARRIEPEATIFRYGGDEFIIHAPKNGEEVAKAIEAAFEGDDAFVTIEWDDESGATARLRVKTFGVRTAVSTVKGGKKNERRQDVLAKLRARAEQEGSSRGREVVVEVLTAGGEGVQGGGFPEGAGVYPDGMGSSTERDKGEGNRPEDEQGAGGATSEGVTETGEGVPTESSEDEEQDETEDEKSKEKKKKEKKTTTVGVGKTKVASAGGGGGTSLPSDVVEDKEKEASPPTEDLPVPGGEGVPKGEGEGTKDTEADDKTKTAGKTEEIEGIEDEYEFPQEEVERIRSGRARILAADNVEAVVVAKKLAQERRPATEQERRALTKFRGWGLLEELFLPDEQLTPETRALRDKLKQALTPQEYDETRRTTINSHYTDPAVAHAIWQALKQAGFSGGTVLEPAVGSGVFIGTLDKETRKFTRFHAIDKDAAAAAITAALYPKSTKVINKPLEMVRLQENAYDVVITNVPFANISIPYEKKGRPKRNFSLHDYFIIRMLDALKPGGLGVVITSRFTLDKLDNRARMEMYERADLVGAIRLPSETFEGYSGTRVVTDILVFRKRKEGEPKGDPTWLEAAPVLFYKTAHDGKVTLLNPDGDRINRWFLTRPDEKTGTRVDIVQEQPEVEEDISSYYDKKRVREHKQAVEAIKRMRETGGIAVPLHEEFEFLSEDVLGLPEIGSGLYSGTELIFTSKKSISELKAVIQNALSEIMYGHYNPEDVVEEPVYDEDIASGAANKEQVFDDLFLDVDEDGKVTVKRIKENEFGKQVLVAEPELNTDEARKTIIAASRLYRAFDAVMSADSAPDGVFTKDQLSKLRKDLAEAYEQFKKIVGTNTPISDRSITKLLGNGPMRWALTALEVEERDKKGNVISFKKSDIFTKPVVASKRTFRPASVADLAAISIATRAELDLGFMANLAIKHLDEYKNMSLDDAKQKLEEELLERGLAFIDPIGGALVDTARYLSGAVRKKLKIATKAAEKDKRFQRNVEALQAVLPKHITLAGNREINLSIGSPVLHPAIAERVLLATIYLAAGEKSEADVQLKKATDLAKRYMAGELTDDSAELRHPSAKAIALLASGRYEVGDIQDVVRLGVIIRLTGFSETRDAVAVLKEAVAAALNNVEPKPKRTKEGDKYVITESAIAMADKAKSLSEMFTQLFRTVVIDSDDHAELREYIEDRFNTMYNGWVAIKPNVEHYRDPETGEYSFIGLNTSAIKPRYYQVKTVWKLLLNGMRGMVAHEVGLGKTLVLTAAALEAKRLGIVNRPVIAVPKSQIEQFTRAARTYFPSARILSSAFVTDAASRRRFYAMITSTEPDIIIMTHEHLTFMQPSPDIIRQIYSEEITEYEEALIQMRKIRSGQEDTITKREYNEIQKAIERLKTEMVAAIEKAKQENVIRFDKAGIDAIIVDEAHYFKSLPVPTTLTRVPGVPQSKSIRALRLLALIRAIELKHGQRRVVLATGTPIANVLPEAYIMAKYVAPDHLKEAGIDTFDRWVAEFAQVTNEPERKATGAIEMKERLRYFKHAGRFRQILEPTWDVELGEAHEDLLNRPKKHEHIVAVEPVKAQLAVVKWLAKRAERLKKLMSGRRAQAGEDNFFLISTDGRKSAVDPRLMVRAHNDKLRGKRLEACADKVAEIYHQTKKEFGTPKAQVIFSDFGINPIEGTKFNVFDELVRLLEERGVPSSEVAIFRTGLSAKRRAALVDGVNDGTYHIAIGSTASLGTGTNIQNRLIAAHHVDPLWTVAHMEQRNGRIWRHGNENQDVHIYYYVTTRTFDEIMYATLDRKARAIHQFLRGNIGDAEFRADAEEQFAYEDVAAVASGDTRIYELVSSENKLNKLNGVIAGISASIDSTKSRISREDDGITWLEGTITMYEDVVEALKQAAASNNGRLTMTLLRPRRFEGETRPITAFAPGQDYVFTLSELEAIQKNVDNAATVQEALSAIFSAFDAGTTIELTPGSATKENREIATSLRTLISQIEHGSPLYFLENNELFAFHHSGIQPFAAIGNVVFGVYRYYNNLTGKTIAKIVALTVPVDSFKSYALDYFRNAVGEQSAIFVLGRKLSSIMDRAMRSTFDRLRIPIKHSESVDITDELLSVLSHNLDLISSIKYKRSTLDEPLRYHRGVRKTLGDALEKQEQELKQAIAERDKLVESIQQLKAKVANLEQTTEMDEEELAVIQFIIDHKVSTVDVPLSDIIDSIEEAEDEEEGGDEGRSDFVGRAIARSKDSRAFVLSLAGHMAEAQAKRDVDDEHLAATTDMIIDFIENKMGIPVRKGRLKSRSQRTILGAHYGKQGFIRLRVANDIEVVAHEVGHAVEERIFKGQISVVSAEGTSTVTTIRSFLEAVSKIHGKETKNQVRGELRAIIQSIYGDRDIPYNQLQIPHEGFANFVAAWLKDGDETAESIAPTTYKVFTDFLRRYADTNEMIPKLYALKAGYEAWREQGAIARAEAQISLRGPSFRQKVLAALSALKDKEYRQLLKDYVSRLFFDRYARLRTFMDWVVEMREKMNKPVTASLTMGAQSPYAVARAFARNASGIARSWVMDGVQDPFTGTKLASGIRDIVAEAYRKVSNIEPDIKRMFYDILLNNYARYTFERLSEAQPKQTGISVADARAIIEHMERKYGDMYSAIDSASRAITRWNHAVIDWLVSVGAVSRKTGYFIVKSALYYIPLHRVMREYYEWELSPEVAGGSRTVGTSPVKRMKGSFRPAIDPFEAMVRQTERFIAAGVKSAWARQVFSLGKSLPGYGRWFIEKSAKETPTLQPVGKVIEQVNELLNELDIKQIEVPQEVLDELFQFWGQNIGATLKEHRTFMVVENGQPRFYEIVDPELWKVLTDADVENIPQWLNVLLKPFRASARMVRLGATGLRARFALVTNPIRDTWEALMGTKGKSLAHFVSIWEPLINAIAGHETESEALWTKLGGKMTTLLGLDREAIKALRDEMLSEAKGGVKEKIKTIYLHPIDTLRALFGFTESVNRVTEFDRVYKDAKKAGFSEDDARVMGLLAAKELTVDFTRAGVISWFLNSIIPFFNPALQDISRVKRLLRIRPKTTMRRGFLLITIPVTAMWLLNSDEDWWNELPYWRRILFVHIPLYKKGKNEPEAIIALPLPFNFGIIFGAIPLMVYEAWRGNKQRLLEYLQTAAKAVTPPLNVPLVSLSYELAKNETWYGKPIVPEALRRVKPEAQFYESTPEVYKFLGKVLGASPLRIQYAIEQLTGGLVKDVDWFTKKVTEPADIPAFGALFERQERLGDSYFRLKNEVQMLEELAATIQRLMLQGDYERAYEIAIDNAEALGIRDSELIRRALRASIKSKGNPRIYFRRLSQLSRSLDKINEMLRQDTATLREITRKAAEEYKRFHPDYVKTMPSLEEVLQ